MTAQIIDGKALAARIRANLAQRVKKLSEAGHRPGLAVVLVGENPASRIYVRNKIAACKEAGIESFEMFLPEYTPQADVLALIDTLNHISSVDGILVQLPLPPQIDPLRVIQTISPEKDVDGFHERNAGRLFVGHSHFIPCTPYGVMKMIESVGYDLKGKSAVVVGRSNIVGKPMAMLLLANDATVTICHSQTQNLAEITRNADVLVACTGKPKIITANMVKPGALVIDVGMNRDENGKLCGDVDPNVQETAGWLTPVPGGVGPMTIAMLLANTVEAVERRFPSQPETEE